MDSLLHASIVEIAAGIRAGKFSPSEVIETYLRRAQSTQRTINAFSHLDAEGAMRRARAADSAVLSNEILGPLHGVPLTIKSCIDVAGWPCEVGSLLRKGYIPQEDAPLVARLKAAGAILLGNTNTPEYLMAYETDNLLYGKTSNPWDLSRSAGGSSGGEAAAIAAGCSAGGVGSDGGGSIRVPAHFCGICGLKPTPGRIPATGHFPSGAGAFSWLGLVGPMARTVGDLRILFSVLFGPDPGDALSAPVPWHPVPENSPQDTYIGVLEGDALGHATPEIVESVQRAAKMLEAFGFKVEPFRLQGLDRAIELWWFFFGTVIGHLFQKSASRQKEQTSPVLREFLEIATVDPAPSFDQFLGACAERDNLRAQILRQMKDAPILLSPVSSTPAFRHGEGTWKGDAGYRETMRFSQWLNLTGFPGVALPISFSKDGLPIGVQLIGRPHEDELLLAVAEQLEESRGTAPSGARRLPRLGTGTRTGVILGDIVGPTGDESD